MELSGATLFFVSLISVVIQASLLSHKLAPSSKKWRPPGPWCVPLIGNLHQVLTSKLPVILLDLVKKHGPVMYLRLGQIDAMVASSPVATQEVLWDKDLTFASWPSILMSQISLYGNLDVAFRPYGTYWRTLRKICMAELLSERKVKQFLPVRDNEIMSLVSNVREASRGRKPFKGK